MDRLLKWLGGRTMVFAVFALTMGTILAWFGKLTMEYVALLGFVQTLVTYRAVQQDKAAPPPPQP